MEKNTDPSTFYAISPKKDCPHYNGELGEAFESFLTALKPTGWKETSCLQCSHSPENWFCLSCSEIHCSRYVNGHMVEHKDKTSHPIAFSFSDGSFWCYQCDSYITSYEMDKLARNFSNLKFSDEKNFDDIAKKIEDISLDAEKKEEKKTKFDYEDVVKGLKENTFKKIAVLTGAGISVSAGIPDFRSPETGLYAKLKDYNLPYAEAVFDINYLLKDPMPFYLVAKDFLFIQKVNPVISHYFITLLNEKKKLLVNLTQNIDGLELDAGLPLEKLVQCHGHLRTAHCVNCKQEGDMEVFKKGIEKQEVYKCDICEGIVKPDVVFFGESLPKEFFAECMKLKQCDIAFVMGTSLTVMPFAMLIEIIPENVPIVIVNRDKLSVGLKKNVVNLQGDIDEQLQKLVKDLGWEEDLEKLKENKKV